MSPDPSMANRLGNLAATYMDLGRHADALPPGTRPWTSPRQHSDPTTRTWASCRGNLAVIYKDLGRDADAVPLEERACRIATARQN